MTAFYETDDKYADIPARLHNPADMERDVCVCTHERRRHIMLTQAGYEASFHRCEDCPCTTYRGANA